MRRLVLVTVLTLGLATGAAACGGGDTQDGKGADVQELQGRVSQLRLEVQNLRKEVAALRDELAGGAVGSGNTTTTTAPPSTTSTSRA
jgi:hypothetical protein